MTKRWLQEIMNLEEVEGAFIATNHGKIVDKLGLYYNDHQLEGLSLYILRIMAAFQLFNKKTTELEFFWQSHYVICKGANNFLLVTFCRSYKEVSLLRLTLNVTMAKLLEDKKFLKSLGNLGLNTQLLLDSLKLDEIEQNLISKLK